MRQIPIMMAITMTWLGCTSARLQSITTRQLERRLQASARKDAPGVVFGAVFRDGTEVIQAVGRAELGTERPMSASTPFAWFSITKLFTAAAILQLMESGRVELDSPVHRYLPEIKVSRAGRDATVRHLLAHAAGLPNPIPVTWVHLASESGPGLNAMVRERLGDAPELDFEPGAKSSYSNLGYLLLGQIVERVSGESYEQYIEHHVLEPLGCKASGFNVSKDRAIGYQTEWSLMGIVARFMLDERFFNGSVNGYLALHPFTVDGSPYGGLGGPVGDLLKFGLMIIRGGAGERGRVLSEASIKAALIPFVDRSGRSTDIGLGWHLCQLDGEPLAYHRGVGRGFRSELRVYPRLGYAVAILANETRFPTEQFTTLVVH